MPPSSTVHRDQNDTKYVTLQVADEIWGDMLEPARRPLLSKSMVLAGIT